MTTPDPKTTTPSDATGYLNDTPENRKALATPQAEGTGTPRADKLWLGEYPHDQERDERLERVLMFARTLERENAHLLTHLRKYDFLAVTHPHLYQGKP